MIFGVRVVEIELYTKRYYTKRILGLLGAFLAQITTFHQIPPILGDFRKIHQKWGKWEEFSEKW